MTREDGKMVFYFTGTGNSRAVGRAMAEENGDTLTDVGALIRENQVYAGAADGPYVFVSPTYAWNLPRALRDWLLKGSFKAGEKAYFVLTCGGHIGAAGRHLSALCAKLGLQYQGTVAIVMPENYLALFPVPDEAKSAALVRQGLQKAADVAQIVAGGYPIAMRREGLLARFLSGPVNQGFYAFYVKDRAFRATDRCVGCGLCESVCPLNNIALDANRRPRWQGRCTHCMACIARCPEQAIEYGKATQGRRRYYLPEN